MSSLGSKHFKWENSPGLEHHCGVCEKPLNNPRAINSCLVKHVEPCYRYHQQFHFIQKSHECYSCNIADEMHHKRHRAIAAQVKDIRDSDESIEQELTCGRKPKSPLPDRPDNVGDSDMASEDDARTSAETPPKLGRKKEKKDRKLAMYLSVKKLDLKIITQGDVHSVSEALHSKKIVSKSSALGDGDELDLESLQVSQAVLKEHLRFSPSERKDIYDILRLTHNRLEKDYTIGPGVFRSNTRRTPNDANFLVPDQSIDNDHLSCLDPKIFERLGVKIVNHNDNRKERKEKVAQLARAIREDLDIVEKDERDTSLRMAAFWRYINKGTLTTLNERHLVFSWATGEIRKETLTRSYSPQVEDENVGDLQLISSSENGPAIVRGKNNGVDQAKSPRGDLFSSSDSEPWVEGRVATEMRRIERLLEAAIRAIDESFPKRPDGEGGIIERATNFEISRAHERYLSDVSALMEKKADHIGSQEDEITYPTKYGTLITVKYMKPALFARRPSASEKPSRIPVPTFKSPRVLRIVNTGDKEAALEPQERPELRASQRPTDSGDMLAVPNARRTGRSQQTRVPVLMRTVSGMEGIAVERDPPPCERLLKSSEWAVLKKNRGYYSCLETLDEAAELCEPNTDEGEEADNSGMTSSTNNNCN